ncbi:hypothetical protein JCM11251_003397 [Rhodosporidiobolus azoricus]
MVFFHLSILTLITGVVFSAPAPLPQTTWSAAVVSTVWYEAPPLATTTPAYTGPWFLAEPSSSISSSSSPSSSFTAEELSSATSSRTTASVSSSSPSSPSSSITSSGTIAGPTGVISSKKGAGYSEGQDYLTRDLAISWAYNWQRKPTDELQEGVTFLPLLWGDDDSNWAEDAQQGIDNGADALLAFNEPDIWSQSALNISYAVDSWKRNFSPFYGKAKLISPAVSNSPQALNIRWLEQFYGNCTTCRDETHAVALHWYSDSQGPEEFKSYFTDAYERLGLPIYITEFGFQRFTNDGNSTIKQEWLQQVIPWLEQSSFIERYGTFVGRFVNKDSTLTQLGEVYSNTV